MMRIFDSHTHTYPETIAQKACENLGQFYEFNVYGKGTYADLEETSRPLGVAGFLLFCVATNAHQVPKLNDSVAALTALSRSRGFETVGFAGMHQDFPDFESEIERCVSLGLRGVKIHPDIQGVNADDPRFFPLYEILQSRNMPVYFHAGDDRPQYRFSSPERLVRIRSLFPALPIVAAHLGGYREWDRVCPLYRGKENIRFDTSSSLNLLAPEKAVSIIRSLGVENVMYGTDYPVTTTAAELDRFLELPLTDQEREDILWNNAARFLGLEG